MKLKLSAVVFLIFSMLASPMLVAAETMIIVVRHAEKANGDSKDPGLSEQGTARAKKLAAVLKDSRIKAVFSTQYKRTRQTGTPVAEANGLKVRVHEVNKTNDKSYVADLVKEIKKKQKGNAVLIVGHSNTVPEIVKYITNIDIDPIAETEFDRIYIITLGDRPRLISTTYNP